MDNNKEQRLAECLQLFEETGDLERCIQLHPDLETELRTQLESAQSLAAIVPPEPAAASQSSSRRLLLSSVASSAGGHSMLKRLKAAPALAAAGVLVLFAVTTVGVGAATGGIPGPNDVLGVLGLHEGNEGRGVSDAVHEIIDSESGEFVEPGPERGQAICEAAHDRSRLPTPAQENSQATPPDCQLGGEGGEGGEAGEGLGGEHGDKVSSDVADAIASTTPGPERGAAVSEAACKAAHDRSNLPNEQAQNGGPETPKECTDEE